MLNNNTINMQFLWSSMALCFGDPTYPYEYLISNINHINMGYWMPDICHIHGGYGISIILHSQGHIGPGGMGYPISHLNDYWSFNNSHIHSGILYIHYPLWRFGVSDIQYHSCPWRILDTQTPRHP